VEIVIGWAKYAELLEEDDAWEDEGGQCKGVDGCEIGVVDSWSDVANCCGPTRIEAPYPPSTEQSALSAPSAASGLHADWASSRS